MQTPYPLSEIDNYSFGFTTDQQVTYIAYFLEYGYMFYDYPDFAADTYTFNIDIVSGNADAALNDDRIGITIVEILRLFFNRIQNVVVYVCDMSDERHMARKRKFDWWFWKYSDGSIIKEDGVAVIEDVQILNSLLVHKDNPHLTAIILAYKDLNDGADEK